MRARALLRTLAALAGLFVFLFAAAALAFTPPPFDNPVVDTAGRLSEDDKNFLNEKLNRYKASSGNQIAVLVAGSLDDLTKEDAAYQTARAWKVLGSEGSLRRASLLTVISMS